MLNLFARASGYRVTDPVGAWLVHQGLRPNAMTVIGTVGSVAAALVLIPRDQLLAATFVIWGFAMFDLFDGAMARAAGGGTRFGSVLDASCDRITDGALLGALAWWCFAVAGDHLAAVAALVCLVTGQVISYIKARAEAAGLSADGGIIERAERLIITLFGTGLQGLGVPYAVLGALCVLAVLSLITVGQRLWAVRTAAREVDDK
jgi:CDP-diacylglycerol--glycerol-3-phosphate 3-phosphatidyltransferase